MTAGLVLALIIIAGLGVLALALIFWGGSKKNRQASYSKEKKKGKRIEDKELIKDKHVSGHLNEGKEPFISNELPTVDKIDSAIASLGFSAIDDLLVQPESLTTAKVDSNYSTLVAPVKFNSVSKQKIIEKDILVLHVMAAPERSFVGYELLQAVTAAGLQFGKMGIFHRFDEAGEQVLFSLCSAVEPGVFDMANMGALSCPGLSLFMRVSAFTNSKTIFNLMFETAAQLAEDLAGHVCDENRQLLTDERLHEYIKIAAQQPENSFRD